MTHPSTRLCLLIGLAVSTSSCSDSGDAVSSRIDEAVCGEQNSATEGETVSLDSAAPVCGQRGAGLVIQFGGGGLVSPGEALLSRELGAVYVVVDSSCKFIAYRGFSDDPGVAVTGRLTAAQAAELDAYLDLEAWSSLAPEYYAQVSDGPTLRFDWGTRSTTMHGGCYENRCGAPPEFPHDANELAIDVAERLQAWGTPVCGAVRYLLIGGGTRPAPDPTDPFYRPDPFMASAAWPLDIAPEEVAANELTPGSNGVHVASEDDAARLRELRRLRAEGVLETWSTLVPAIPIEQPDGSRYLLYVRDVVEFERDNRPWVPWTELNVY